MSVYTGGGIIDRLTVHGSGSSLKLGHPLGGVTSVFTGGGVSRRVMPCSRSVIRFEGGSNGSTNVSSVFIFLLIESYLKLTSGLSVRDGSRLLIDH